MYIMYHNIYRFIKNMHAFMKPFRILQQMNVSAHEAGNARFQFFARIIDIAKEYQWFGDASHAPQPHEPHRHPYIEIP